MAQENKEPQSYGSQADWSTGNTGEKVNDPKSSPPPEHADFYESRRESEDNGTNQGGSVSPFQLTDNVDVAHPTLTTAEEVPLSPKVTTAEGGARRDSYFRDRDYK